MVSQERLTYADPLHTIQAYTEGGVSMRTTLDLNEKLIRELMDVTSAKTKTDAIHQAAEELIRRKKLDQLKSLSGTLSLDLNWKKLEATELRHQASLKRRRHGHR